VSFIRNLLSVYASTDPLDTRLRWLTFGWCGGWIAASITFVLMTL
jgi:hypothetical protein